MYNMHEYAHVNVFSCTVLYRGCYSSGISRAVTVVGLTGLLQQWD